jgi:hypothetical protein
MRHLATWHDVTLSILHHLWRRQRRRLGGNRDCVHGAAGSRLSLAHGTHDITEPQNVAECEASSTEKTLEPLTPSGRDPGVCRTCMKPMMESAPLVRFPPHSLSGARTEGATFDACKYGGEMNTSGACSRFCSWVPGSGLSNVRY